MAQQVQERKGRNAEHVLSGLGVVYTKVISTLCYNNGSRRKICNNYKRKDHM